MVPATPLALGGVRAVPGFPLLVLGEAVNVIPGLALGEPACVAAGLPLAPEVTVPVVPVAGVVPFAAVVPGAAVTITNSATGFTRTTQTDSQGSYQFLELPPATYQASVSAASFATIKQTGVQLLVATLAGVLRAFAWLPSLVYHVGMHHVPFAHWLFSGWW